VDPRVPRRRNSRAQFKRIRNRRNRRIRREVRSVIDHLLDRVTESLENASFGFPTPSPSARTPSPISEERFPSPSRYDPVSSPFSSPIPASPLSPTCYSPPPVAPPASPDVPPLSPSSSSSSSVEFLGEIPAASSSSSLYSHDLEESPFLSTVTRFPQAEYPPPPGVYTIGPGAVDLGHLKRVVSTAHPDHGIFVYLPGIPLPYSVPVSFFYNHFPPSSLSIQEL